MLCTHPAAALESLRDGEISGARLLPRQVQDFVSCYGPLRRIWAGRSTVRLPPRRGAMAGSHSIGYFLLQGLRAQNLSARLGKEVCEGL